jgi:hypothetical protein
MYEDFRVALTVNSAKPGHPEHVMNTDYFQPPVTSSDTTQNISTIFPPNYASNMELLLSVL